MAPIHNAAQNGNLNRVKALLNQGVPVNARTVNGRTALHWAAQAGSLSVVQELLKRGAHVNPRTRSGMTPLHVALVLGRSHIVHALLKAGAKAEYRNINGRSNAFTMTTNSKTRNALKFAKAARAATKWNNMTRKRRAERMLLSPRLLGSKPLNNNAIRSIARYLTVKKV